MQILSRFRTLKTADLFRQRTSTSLWLLLQAFVGNASSCGKVQDRHIHKVLDQVCKFKEQVPEYLDVLYSMVRLVDVDTPLRRNQAVVMKYLMRSFKHAGADFSSETDVRYSINNSSTHSA